MKSILRNRLILYEISCHGQTKRSNEILVCYLSIFYFKIIFYTFLKKITFLKRS